MEVDHLPSTLSFSIVSVFWFIWRVTNLSKPKIYNACEQGNKEGILKFFLVGGSPNIFVDEVSKTFHKKSFFHKYFFEEKLFFTIA